MNRIDAKNALLKKNKKKAFVAYITAGFPNTAVTEKLIPVLEKNGADFIELGMPFSDPIADGPTIQKSSYIALKNGMTMNKFFRLVRNVRKKSQVPLIMMTYYNLIYNYGFKRFAEIARKSGLDGVIVPDLPIEEAQDLNENLRSEKISLIFLISPVTEKSRMKKISKVSEGFIYYVSLTGVTGVRDKLPDDLVENVRLIKNVTKKPVYVGFGVSTSEQVKQVSETADGVIVGSAIIKAITENYGKKDFLKKVGRFIAALSKGVNG
ncbi:MAG: tryptophan synthase subunit alpha [Candidatus Omnitrophota bacterium]